MASLSRPRYAVPVVMAILVVPWLVVPGETAVRVSSVLLQWLGVGTVAYGLGQTRTRLGLPSFVARLEHLLGTVGRVFRRLVGKKPAGVIVGTAVGMAASVGVAAEGTVWRNPMGKPTADERIEALHANVEELKQQVTTLRQRTRDEADAQRQRLEEEQRARTAAVEEVRKLVGDLLGSGLDVEAFGLVCLLVGIPLGTFASEIAALATRVW